MSKYDPYQQYNPYDYNPYGAPYQKVPSKGAAWAWLIFATIIALVDVYFWLPFARACAANNHNVLATIQAYPLGFAAFAGIAAVFFIFSVIANVKFSRCSKFWGRSFGGFLGKFLIFLEYLAYVGAVLLFFI